MKNIIWQYWETKSFKPPFVEELEVIARKNSGVELVVVTPSNIRQYLPSIPDEIFQIDELAHKADMIRALLIYEHGGMWLDSDAIVLTDLNWLFSLLDNYEFVGFNNTGTFSEAPLNVRINCFLSRKKSNIMYLWTQAQHAKFPRKVFEWTEVGTQLLDPIIAEKQTQSKLIPFDLICPIRWNEVEKFSSCSLNSSKILDDTIIVMLSNKALEASNSELRTTSLISQAKGDSFIADVINRALDTGFEPNSRL